jgi:hypothetical protein
VCLSARWSTKSRRASPTLIVLDDAASNLIGDVHGHITAPALGDVEGDDADQVAVLARKQQADHCLAVSSIFVCLALGSPEPGTEVIQHDVRFKWTRRARAWAGSDKR